MATINLLPWRDEFRQEKKREFFSVLILLGILAVLVCYVWISFIEAKVSEQRSRNSLFKKEISTLNAKVSEIEKLKKQRVSLESKMDVIQSLQNKRPLIVHYFDEMVRVMPDGVYLNSLSKGDDSYSIKGIAESNNRVSTLMRNLDGSRFFESPNLKNVVKDAFELTVDTVVPAEFTASVQK
jgi:type IV pilus assembly protein PilN